MSFRHFDCVDKITGIYIYIKKNNKKTKNKKQTHKNILKTFKGIEIYKRKRRIK